ncbi:hypothetical protein K402DRAFT_98340 [Aulographum hederae CBS 113979]|uniref:Uncharacterized protein n=1 Tax=Aulographum hederae CBS 113979 TaxID=1176131 RepID=A0A6G1GZ27_9PEZI|nr:hypothetical protein K402DRAFT_98340 [Aulographum hederae CBS 113979]
MGLRGCLQVDPTHSSWRVMIDSDTPRSSDRNQYGSQWSPDWMLARLFVSTSEQSHADSRSSYLPAISKHIVLPIHNPCKLELPLQQLLLPHSPRQVPVHQRVLPTRHLGSAEGKTRHPPVDSDLTLKVRSPQAKTGAVLGEGDVLSGKAGGEL